MIATAHLNGLCRISILLGGSTDMAPPPSRSHDVIHSAPPREIKEAHRAARIATDAAKAPIVLARFIVERHIRDLRARGLVRVTPNTPALVLALEQLTHDVASAVLDARKAPR